MPFLVKKTHPKAILPFKATDGSAGYDLSSVGNITIPPKGKALVPTGLIMTIPFGMYGRIAPRSSLAWKHHIDVGAGVIDSDYRGDVGVVLFNHSEKEFKINEGDRVAQIILEKCYNEKVIEEDIITQTLRGEGGFGHTGV